MCALSSERSRRILVIAPNWIGDAVMAQPLLALLRTRATHLAMLTIPSVAPVAEAMREVDEVLVMPFQQKRLQLRARWQLARRLRSMAFDEAYVLPNTLKFALLPWWAGIPLRIGYKGEHRYGLINRMHHDDPLQPRAMVPFYAALAHAPQEVAPADVPMPRLSLSAGRIARTLAAAGFTAQTPIVVFAPGAEFGPAKRWPATRFAALAERIGAAFPEARVLLLGGPGDREAGQEIAAHCPAVLDLTGKTTLAQAMDWIAAARVVVSNDSGLLHIASALSRPVLGIYGPTDPGHAPPFSEGSQTFSLHLECAPCRQRTCPLGHQRCMSALSEMLLWNAVQGMMPVAQGRSIVLQGDA